MLWMFGLEEWGWLADVVVGLLGSGLIAGLAYRKRSLSGSGALAAVVVGTVLYALGNLAWFGTLIAFFLSSTLLSKWKKKAKAELEDVYEKGDRRDAGQVLANGGLGALLCVASYWVPDAVIPREIWWLLFFGVMATVTADTWATEVGGLNRRPPRSILTWKRVPPGTSGGVTPLGLLASMAGGLFIGVVAFALLAVPGVSGVAGACKCAPSEPGFWAALFDGRLPLVAYGPALIFIGPIAGLVGSLTDSLLGARLQVMYRCEVCGRELEKKRHCDAPALRVRGIGWMNNDAVNLISSVAGGVAAWLIGVWLL